MLELIDPAVLTAFFQNLDLATSSSLASFFSFFHGIQSWRESQRSAQQHDDLDAYVDYLRRNEHQTLVDLILQHRLEFQKLFDQMENAVVAAIDRLNDEQQRRHEEQANLDIQASRVIVSEESGFTADIWQQRPEWQSCLLKGRFRIVNRNNSPITIRAGKMTVTRGGDRFLATLDPRSSVNAQIDGGGNARIIEFRSSNEVQWQQGTVYTPTEMSLEVLQSDDPLEFVFVDGKARPK